MSTNSLRDKLRAINAEKASNYPNPSHFNHLNHRNACLKNDNNDLRKKLQESNAYQWWLGFRAGALFGFGLMIICLLIHRIFMIS